MIEEMKKCFDIEKIKEQFSYLEKEFNFELIGFDEEKYTLQVLYKNNTTAIRISFEPYDVGIIISIIKLVNGKIIENPKPLKKDTKVNIFDLGDLINLRNPSLWIEITQKNHPGALTVEEFENITLIYASALKKYGDDILSGNFGMFNELNRIVIERAIAYGQIK